MRSWIDFHEIWYKYYTTGGHPIGAFLNFLLRVILTWRTDESEETLAPHNFE